MLFNPVVNEIQWGLAAFFMMGILINLEDYVKTTYC
jgi:hypothetical protein